MLFQSLSGFWWGFCIRAQRHRCARHRRVSIPFRVLVGFLRAGGGDFRGGGVILFQSLSGFWWGFCPVCPPPGGEAVLAAMVSIPFRVLVGFLPPEKKEEECCGFLVVSIPFRVLVGFLLTPQILRAVNVLRSFNPFQGFGGVSA